MITRRPTGTKGLTGIPLESEILDARGLAVARTPIQITGEAALRN